MKMLAIAAVAAASLVSAPASADCTFGEAQRLMADAMQALQQLEARNPQRARSVEAEIQRRMAQAMNTMPSGRVPSDNAPVPDAVCDFWEDVRDLIED